MVIAQCKYYTKYIICHRITGIICIKYGYFRVHLGNPKACIQNESNTIGRRIYYSVHESCGDVHCIWGDCYSNGKYDSIMRVGIGYDVHQLVDGRPMIIGGVTIDHSKGLLGHSDADVLSHAITDAMLGALAMGSIGDWFPDTDPAYKDADSLYLLRNIYDKVIEKGYTIGNIDSVIIAQEPKFKPYINAIQQSLASTLGCAHHVIGVKATTTEQLGFVGKKEGIAAQAVVLLEKA